MQLRRQSCGLLMALSGQGVSEYALVLSLVVLVSILGMSLMGDRIREMLGECLQTKPPSSTPAPVFQ